MTANFLSLSPQQKQSGSVRHGTKKPFSVWSLVGERAQNQEQANTHTDKKHTLTLHAKCTGHTKETHALAIASAMH
ncbi:unnamed protein product [Leuciscus chuanchicus]